MERSHLTRLGVVAAAAIVLALAGVVVARAIGIGRGAGAAYASTAPPAATVPPPRPCDLAALAMPCWGCPAAEEWPLRYVTDLDMLAPLGTGSGNTAVWFAAFARPDGPRLAEAEAAAKRRVSHGPLAFAPEGFAVLPPADPLLAEAEPWCDQATMRFYPEIFPVEGGRTRIANLLLALTLARSWIARGHDAADYESAMADFRRVIRFGRLLRQEDVVLIDDIVGLSFIRWGAEAIYDRARATGHTELALLAAVVAGEGAPQRYLTAARVTAVDVAPYLRRDAAGVSRVDIPAERFKAMREMATSCPDRRFRSEVTLSLRLVAALGAGRQQAEARETLQGLASGDDAIVAANARWSLATPVADAEVRSLLGEADGTQPRRD
jgi:hypothetical protein